MPKVMFFFAGTGGSGKDIADTIEYEIGPEGAPDVVRVYLEGCQNQNIGGRGTYSGMISPNLEVGANKILTAFRGNELDINKLRQNLGSGIARIEGLDTLTQKTDTGKIEVESIGLTGFSRGAVGTFVAARKLNALGVDMHLFANQPVPGVSSETEPLCRDNADLTACQNIKSATTLFASHDLNNGIMHDTFFSQMRATFPESCDVQEILLPHQNHWGSAGYKFGLYRTCMALVSHGFFKDKGYEAKLSAEYSKRSLTSYTPHKFAQKIFGNNAVPIEQDPIYLKIQKEKALNCLEKLGIAAAPENLSTAQTRAIIAITNMEAMTQVEQAAQIKLALDDGPDSKKFVRVVNEAADMCDYLSVVTQKKAHHFHLWDGITDLNDPKYADAYIWDDEDEVLHYNNSGISHEVMIEGAVEDKVGDELNALFKTSKNKPVSIDHVQHASFLALVQPHSYHPGKKSLAIKTHGASFQKEVFTASYCYLRSEQAQSDQTAFKKHLESAEKTFQENALNTEKSTRSVWLPRLQQFRAFIFRVIPIDPSVLRTRAENVVRKTTQSIMTSTLPKVSDEKIKAGKNMKRRLLEGDPSRSDSPQQDLPKHKG